MSDSPRPTPFGSYEAMHAAIRDAGETERLAKLHATRERMRALVDHLLAEAYADGATPAEDGLKMIDARAEGLDTDPTEAVFNEFRTGILVGMRMAFLLGQASINEGEIGQTSARDEFDDAAKEQEIIDRVKAVTALVKQMPGNDGMDPDLIEIRKTDPPRQPLEDNPAKVMELVQKAIRVVVESLGGDPNTVTVVDPGLRKGDGTTLTGLSAMLNEHTSRPAKAKRPDTETGDADED